MPVRDRRSLEEELQRIQLAVAFAPKGMKLRRMAELRAWVRSQLERETGRQQSLMWAPIGIPVPEGWHLARQKLGQYSHNFSQLIEQDRP